MSLPSGQRTAGFKPAMVRKKTAEEREEEDRLTYTGEIPTLPYPPDPSELIQPGTSQTRTSDFGGVVYANIAGAPTGMWERKIVGKTNAYPENETFLVDFVDAGTGHVWEYERWVSEIYLPAKAAMEATIADLLAFIANAARSSGKLRDVAEVRFMRENYDTPENRQWQAERQAEKEARDAERKADKIRREEARRKKTESEDQREKVEDAQEAAQERAETLLEREARKRREKAAAREAQRQRDAAKVKKGLETGHLKFQREQDQKRRRQQRDARDKAAARRKREQRRRRRNGG